MLKNWSVTFLYFGMKLPMEGINQLWKGGFGWIVQRVIFQGRKSQKMVKFGYFSDFWPISQKLFWNFFSNLAWCFPFMLLMNYEKICGQNMCTVESVKMSFCKVRKVKFGPLWSIWANILETVHVMPKVSMKHIIGSHIIYDLSVDLMTFDLGLFLNVKSRSF